MAREQVLISVAGSREQLMHLVPELEQAGVEIGQVLELSGIITGSVDPENLATLEALAGISAVEMSRAYQLAPPESDVQAVEEDTPHLKGRNESG